ncbi:glycosyltransferase [Yersinia enterocolitica]|uniref:glycosyltransferase n=4 Tax=Yersinia enterocolitica TaxID=630 RepID=UPI0021E8D0CD|nr:glycosyltransferase [Yersinia enterocolitica]UYJ81052.1 glycosyltransferase [Yersinia enterocolitica]HDL8331410.1 glycosyltransferase [Yersinia enterocolitica]HDM8454452.1 glycosyltransferase [Yersinia enterocolitica]
MLNKLSHRSRWQKKFGDSVRLAYSKSSYKDTQSFDWFLDNVYLISTKKDSHIDFNEEFYLKNNIDVRKAVENGSFCCGYIHFCLCGHLEPRFWSTKRIFDYNSCGPHLAEGLAEPLNARALPIYTPDLSQLPPSDYRSIVIFIPYLIDDLFFAGYTGFFSDLSKIFDHFDSITVVVSIGSPNPRLLDRYSSKIKVISLSDVEKIESKPDLIYCFDTETFFQASDIFKSPEITVYYCQDFEPGFFPFGSMYTRALSALYLSKNIIFSTKILKDFVVEKCLLNSHANLYITAPIIEPIECVKEKKNRIFFYFRPEKFNSRNMPEVILTTVEQFCKKHSGYEIFLVGTVDTSYSIKIHNTDVTVLSKLPKKEYIDLLASCDVVIALIYSAHPGVIAFQAAASGIPTVTNEFDNRKKDYFLKISNNLIPYNPVVDSLLEKIEEALSLSKGDTRFDYAAYAGLSRTTFEEFNYSIQKSVKKP